MSRAYHARNNTKQKSCLQEICRLPGRSGSAGSIAVVPAATVECIYGLKDKEIRKNPNTVLRIMQKYNLLSEVRR